MDRTVLIRDVLEVPARCLGQSMDEAFDRLYDSLFGGVSPNLEDFREAALKYFDTVSGDSTRQDEYFVCFTPVWNFYLADGKRGDAEGLWRLALDPVLLWQNANPGQFIHKGTAYYFWAMTALLQGGIDRGYILMHQAFAEDCRTSGNPRPYTPAFAFVSLESDEPNQAFKDWVQEQARFLDGFVKDYSATFSRPFTIDEFRKRYLRNPPVIDAVFQLTHTMARLWDIGKLPEESRQNPFVGQIQLNLLFDLLLLIDNAISHKSGQWKFFDHVIFLLNHTPHPILQSDLQDINRQLNTSFDATLSAALAGSLAANGKSLDRLQCDVIVAYGLRNRGAHEIENVPIILNAIDDTQRAIFRAFIGVVDLLY